MPDNPEKAGFDAACGVNVVVTIEEIEQVVSNVLNECSADLESKRYQMLGLLLGKLKNHLRWANQMTVKQVLDKKMLEILGPKDERDDPKTKVFIHLSHRKRKKSSSRQKPSRILQKSR